MRILFFTKGDRSIGSSRQRIWNVADHLEREFSFVCNILYPKIFHITSPIKAMRDADVLYVHKSLFSWKTILTFVFFKVFHRKKLIYDLDDAEWEHSFLKTLLLVRMADIVLCGSHIILGWCKKYNIQSFLIPTALDHVVYASYADRDKSSILTVGWVGTGKGHFQDGHFDVLKKALDVAYEKIPLRFIIIGSMNYEPLKSFFKGSLYDVVYVDDVRWEQINSVPKVLQEYNVEVGLMFVSDTPFNRAKCAFKAIEYMASGVVAIASPVGEASILIQDGVNGFLANSADEWVKKIIFSAEDFSKREKVNKAASETIRSRYSYQAIIPQIDALLRSLS